MAGSTHDRKIRKLGLLGFGAAIAAGLVLALSLPATGATTPTWIVYPALLMLMAGVVLAGIPWWRALDDVQKQGQTHSWYWGSMIAAVSVLMWLVATTGRHSEMSLGAAYLFVAQGIGFGVVWLVWRFRGRGAGE